MLIKQIIETFDVLDIKPAAACCRHTSSIPFSCPTLQFPLFQPSLIQVPLLGFSCFRFSYSRFAWYFHRLFMSICFLSIIILATVSPSIRRLCSKSEVMGCTESISSSR